MSYCWLKDLSLEWIQHLAQGEEQESKTTLVGSRRKKLWPEVGDGNQNAVERFGSFHSTATLLGTV